MDTTVALAAAGLAAAAFTALGATARHWQAWIFTGVALGLGLDIIIIGAVYS